MKFSPKIFRTKCWNVWDCFRAAQDYVEYWFWSKTDVFRFCCVFGVWAYFLPNYGSGKWIESELVQGLLRLDDTLLN